MPAPLSFAVIGAGRLGARHAEKLSGLPDARLVAVSDLVADRARAAAEPAGALAICDFTEIPQVDAAVVAVPTREHHRVARQLIDRGVHVLVEKPLATTPDEARDLIAAARAADVRLQVGHVERFNPAVAGALPKVTTPLFIEVHRIAPFSFRSTDIGVIMDLMIHDIDLLLDVTGETPQTIHAHGAAVITEHEDIAGARLEFPSGCVANLTASRLGLKHERKFRIFQPMAYISLDLLAREGYLVTKGEGFDELDLERLDPEALEDPLDFLTANLIRMEPIEAPADADPLRDELAAFCRAVRGDAPVVVPGEAGLAAMETAERIRAAARIVKRAGRGGGA